MDDEIMTMSVTENPTEDMRGYIHYEGSNVYVEIYDRKCRDNLSETIGSVYDVTGDFNIDKIDFNCHLYCNYQHTGTLPIELTTLRGCMIESVVYRTKKGAFWTAVQRLTACPYDENPSGKKPKVYTRTNYGYNTANAFSATNWSDWKCEDNAIEAEATARAAADTAEATARAAADEALKSDIGDLDDLTFEAESVVDAVNQAYEHSNVEPATMTQDDDYNITITDGLVSGGGGSTGDAYTKAEVDAKLAAKANTNHTHDYNSLSNKPTIPAATTVTQTLTSGTEIGSVNGVKLYAPNGGGTTYTAGNGISIENGVISLSLSNAEGVGY